MPTPAALTFNTDKSPVLPSKNEWREAFSLTSAWPKTITPQIPSSNPSQNGKNPGWGCPTDQPDPTDLACTTIAIANAMKPSAVRISARRTIAPLEVLSFADGTEQAALDHQVSVEGVGLLEPLYERRGRPKLPLS